MEGGGTVGGYRGVWMEVDSIWRIGAFGGSCYFSWLLVVAVRFVVVDVSVPTETSYLSCDGCVRVLWGGGVGGGGGEGEERGRGGGGGREEGGARHITCENELDHASPFKSAASHRVEAGA